MFCNECGREIEDNSKFCKYCGHNFEVPVNNKNIGTESHPGTPWEVILENKNTIMWWEMIGFIGFLVIMIFLPVFKFNRFTWSILKYVQSLGNMMSSGQIDDYWIDDVRDGHTFVSIVLVMCIAVAIVGVVCLIKLFIQNDKAEYLKYAKITLWGGFIELLLLWGTAALTNNEDSMLAGALEWILNSTDCSFGFLGVMLTLLGAFNLFYCLPHIQANALSQKNER